MDSPSYGKKRLQAAFFSAYLHDFHVVRGVQFQTSRAFLKKPIRENKIECIKVGRSYRIPKAHLLTYMRVF